MRLAALAGTVLVGLAGCGSSDPETTTTTSTSPPRVERLAYAEMQAL